MSSHLRLMTAALGLLFLVLHLLSLPRSLEDIDTINFALGVESFDVARHQPHPPGYPVFIAMAKVSTAAVELAVPSWDRTRRAAVGLAVWGIAAGSVFAWVLVGFWRSAGWSPIEAWFAAALAVLSPLFWFTAARPLTDAVALVGATAVQWMLLRLATGDPRDRPMGRLYLAALAAGLLIGVRTQTMWLTAPLLGWVVGRLVVNGRLRDAAIAVGASAAGCLAWAVPLVAATGGLGAYMTALSAQGGEDFSNIPMLATTSDMQLVAESLRATFIGPWRVAWLGQVTSVLAVAGLAHLIWRSSSRAWLLVVAFVPYLVFHLAFHEVDHIRYALPAVVPMAGLAIRGLFLLPARIATTVGALVLIASGFVAQESLGAYGRLVPPTFAAFHEAERAASGRDPVPVVVTHLGMRRVADWYRPEWPELPALSSSEPGWLWVVDYFRRGGTAPVWWLADKRRTDLVLFDPRARAIEREFPQDREVRRLIGQGRQDEVTWWTIASPQWLLGRGWALSAEVAGVTFATGRDPRVVPAEAYLRRVDVPTRVMIGGRHLSGSRAAVVHVDLDGQPVSRWVVEPGEPSFLYFIDLPAGALRGDGPFATMRVRVEVPDASDGDPRIGLDQFDFSPAADVVAGFADGWYAWETDQATGRTWRWAGPSATLLVAAGEGPAQLTLAGESSRRYFDRPSTITVSVEGRNVARFTADRDFLEVIDLPAEWLTAVPSRVTLTLDQSHVPAERGESEDRRDLALRFFTATVTRR